MDYSQKGFVIFLTEDHKLYGLGNAGCGALQQYDTFDGNRYLNDEQYFVSEPYLLMEQVKYACCGRDDIVCLAEDNTVWTWGTVWCNSGAATLQTSMVSDGLYFIPKPQKFWMMQSWLQVAGITMLLCFGTVRFGLGDIMALETVALRILL